MQLATCFSSRRVGYRTFAKAPAPKSRLTKTIGNAILLTDQTVDALDPPPHGLINRGAHALKGKSATTKVFGLDPVVARLDRRG